MNRTRAGILLAGSLLAGLLGGGSCVGASPGTSSSAASVFTSGVFQYRDYATIRTEPGQVRGSSAIRRLGGTTPTNYVGANARYFRASNDAMVAETGFYYNSEPIPDGLNLSVTTPRKISTGISYYSWGVVKGSNSASYATYYTFKSPNQSS
jgi:hypothetical protein